MAVCQFILQCKSFQKIVGPRVYSYRKLEKIGYGALQFFPIYLLFKSCVQSHLIMFSVTPAYVYLKCLIVLATYPSAKPLITILLT